MKNLLKRMNERLDYLESGQAALVIAAAAKAEAIKREQLSLTPMYIQYITVEKWDGVLPTVSNGGGGLMLQLPIKK